MVCEELLQYYDYIIIISEVLMYTFLPVLFSAVCSPLLVKYSAMEMAAVVIITIIHTFTQASGICNYGEVQLW